MSIIEKLMKNTEIRVTIGRDKKLQLVGCRDGQANCIKNADTRLMVGVRARKETLITWKILKSREPRSVREQTATLKGPWD